MRVEPNADFEQSLLSAGEYQLFLKQFPLSAEALSKPVYLIEALIDISFVDLPKSFDEAAGQIVQSFSILRPLSRLSVKPLIKFMVEHWSTKLKDKFCDIFKFNGIILSGW